MVAGQHGLAYKLGRCCAPHAGTPVVGYLTLSRGVTVHEKGCANLLSAPKERLLEVDWI
jgi:GTP pyrophosphokinase